MVPRVFVWSVLLVALGSPGVRAEKPALRATGMVMYEEVVDVGATVAGKVIALGTEPEGTKSVDYNSRVKAGAVLVKLDPTPYENEAALARADLAVAEAEVQQAEAELALAVLKRKRGKDPEADALEVKVAEAKVARVQGGVRKARVLLNQTTVRVDRCTIRSPVDGVILDRRVVVGQTADTSAAAPPLFQIATDPQRLQVWVSVREGEISRILVGQKVTFKVDAYPKDTFTGTVALIRHNATLGKDGAVSYTVIVKVKEGTRLLPYLTAEVEIPAGI
jgi:HlyD family secretion protein